MSETLIQRWMARPHFTCPRCDATSWNENDIRENYCGRCHLFFAPPATVEDFQPYRERRVEALRPRPRPHARPAEEPSGSSARHDDEPSNLPTFPTFSPPDPPAAPDPPAFDPGGGSSGGGGASGDY
jgi:hypothetical protein